MSAIVPYRRRIYRVTIIINGTGLFVIGLVAADNGEFICDDNADTCELQIFL